MYQMQEVAKCYLFLILLDFYENIYLDPNQLLKHLLCFNFIYEDLRLQSLSLK